MAASLLTEINNMAAAHKAAAFYCLKKPGRVSPQAVKLCRGFFHSTVTVPSGSTVMVMPSCT